MAIGGADVDNGDAAEAGIDGRLISNRTVLVQPLNARRAMDSEKLEVVDVKDLASAVIEFKPTAEFQLEAATLGEGGKVEVGSVAIVMRYGEDNAARVIEDFSPEGLAGKAVNESGQNEVERRPLLRGRLQSQVIEQLADKLKNPTFASQVDDPTTRKAILEELDRRIAEIERMKGAIEIEAMDRGN
jgi:hypothetical protein